MRYSKLFVLLFLLLTNKQMPKASAFPIFASCFAAAAAEADPAGDDIPPAEASGEQPPDATTQAKEKKQKMKEMWSSCQAAAIALATERNILGMDLIHFYVEPFRNMLRRIEAQLRQGPAGVRDLFSGLACGKHAQPAQETLALKFNPTVLAECGLVLAPGTQQEAEAFMNDPVALEQDAIAKEIDKLAWHLASEHTQEGATHTCEVILLSAGLLSSDPRQVEGTLAKLSNIHGAWQAIKEQRKNPVLRNLIERSNNNGAIEQEILTELAEVSFSEVPSSVANLVSDIFHSFGSSLIVERGFQVWEEKERRGHL